MEWLKDIATVCQYVGVALSVLTAYEVVFFAVGIFFRKRFKKTEERRRYALCVPARNEEKVIQNFLESVANSDYPLEKLTVFIVADNCTDQTAQISRSYRNKRLRVIVYEHNAADERTKGYALRYLFEKIEKDYGVENFDGYFIFDAYNVISSNYITKMNEAFVAGNKIVTSFRNSKNLNRNWISFGYGMHWMRTCLYENRAKSLLGLACRIQGTGFLFSNELVRQGWKYTSLTEDRSFCSDAVVQGYKICYCDEAVFYDEQPYRLKIDVRQRIRWAKGHLGSTVENCPKLLKNMFIKRKNFLMTYDCFWLNFPSTVERAVRKIIRLGIQITLAVLAYNLFGWLKGAFWMYVGDVFGKWLGYMAYQICILIVYRKRIEKGNGLKRFFHMALFPLFDVIGRLATYIALFTKVEWKMIPHETVMDVSQLNNV